MHETAIVLMHIWVFILSLLWLHTILYYLTLYYSHCLSAIQFAVVHLKAARTWITRPLSWAGLSQRHAFVSDERNRTNLRMKSCFSLHLFTHNFTYLGLQPLWLEASGRLPPLQMWTLPPRGSFSLLHLVATWHRPTLNGIGGSWQGPFNRVQKSRPMTCLKSIVSNM